VLFEGVERRKKNGLLKEQAVFKSLINLIEASTG